MADKVALQKKGKKVSSHKSWYSDKHGMITTQRNLLFATCIIMFIAVIVALATIKFMIEKNAIEPYVIRVSKTDVIPTSVPMDSVKTYADANQSVIEYFITQYVKARESYSAELYNYNYNTVVNSMSTRKVYGQFYNAVVRDQQNSPIIRLNTRGEMDVIIKQVTSEIKNHITTFRIAKRVFIDGTITSVTHYQIKIHYIFDTLNLTYKDITINPLGIKVDAYDMVEEKTIVNDEIFSKLTS